MVLCLNRAWRERYDWMKIKWRDGFAFVLYQNGKFAEKND